MDTFKPPRLPVREEVQNFVLAAERLLSPCLRRSELTPEECHIICEYLRTMCHGTHPWSNQFMRMEAAQPASEMAPLSNGFHYVADNLSDVEPTKE